MPGYTFCIYDILFAVCSCIYIWDFAYILILLTLFFGVDVWAMLANLWTLGESSPSTTVCVTNLFIIFNKAYLLLKRNRCSSKRCAGRRNSGLFFLFHPLKKMIYISFVQKKRTLMTSSSYDVYGCIDQLFTYKQTMLISGRRCADVRRCIQHFISPTSTSTAV